MPLPKRSESRSVRVPRFLRGGDLVRPARFGTAPEVIPAPAGEAQSEVKALATADVPLVTMPLPPTEEAGVAALPEVLLEEGSAILDDEGEGEMEGELSADAALPPLLEAAEDQSADEPSLDASDSEETSSSAPPIDDALLAEIGTAIAEIGEGARRDALALGLSLARRLVGLYIEADEEALRLLIEQAFARLSAATSLDVAVHPEDLAFFETPESGSEEDRGVADGDATSTTSAEESAPSAPKPLPSPARAGAQVRLVADASLARGEVRVTSDVGEIDATLDARIAVARAVLEELE